MVADRELAGVRPIDVRLERYDTGPMSERSNEAAETEASAAKAGDDAERRGPPPNPIHHPLFLPVLLVAFTLWFGYDGFLTTDPEMLEHQGFNRLMFVIMQPICLRAVPRGIAEFLEDRQAELRASA